MGKRGPRPGAGQKKGGRDFKPGESGNKGGKSKKNAEVSELAKEESIPAFTRIIQLGQMVGTTTDSKLLSIANNANQYIVDRAIGKPSQQTKFTADKNTVPFMIQIMPHDGKE